MITINLLTPARRRSAQLAPATLAVAGGFVALLVILGAATWYLGNRAASLHAQLNDVTRQIDALRPVAQDVERLDALVKSLETRQARLKDLLATQLPASQSLEALKAVIPSDVWLTNVTTQGGHSVLFDGYTFAFKSVARFMVSLRDSGRYQNIDLTSTSKDKVGERDVVKFQITGDLVTGPAKAETPAVPAVSASTAPAPASRPVVSVGGIQ